MEWSSHEHRLFQHARLCAGEHCHLTTKGLPDPRRFRRACNISGPCPAFTRPFYPQAPVRPAVTLPSVHPARRADWGARSLECGGTQSFFRFGIRLPRRRCIGKPMLATDILLRHKETS
jgi:hypothetical protein